MASPNPKRQKTGSRSSSRRAAEKDVTFGTYSGVAMPNKPRGPRTPYNYFETYEQCNRIEVLKLPRKYIAQKWREANRKKDKELEKFKAMAREDEERFTREMKEYAVKMAEFKATESAAEGRFREQQDAAETMRRAEEQEKERRVQDRAFYRTYSSIVNLRMDTSSGSAEYNGGPRRFGDSYRYMNMHALENAAPYGIASSAAGNALRSQHNPYPVTPVVSSPASAIGPYHPQEPRMHEHHQRQMMHGRQQPQDTRKCTHDGQHMQALADNRPAARSSESPENLAANTLQKYQQSAASQSHHQASTSIAEKEQT